MRYNLMVAGTKLQIELLLYRIKKALSDDKDRLHFINRQKNMATILDNNLALDDVVTILMNLNPSNYRRGPNVDRDNKYQEDVWEFEYEFGGIKLYIKLKLFSNNKLDYVKCISFHKCEHDWE